MMSLASTFRIVLVAMVLIVLARHASAQSAGAAQSTRAPTHLRCEFLDNPMGIESARPQLSWRMDDEGRGASQTGYQVLVVSSPENLDTGRGDLWDSGWVESDRSHLVTYTGAALTSRRQCWWQVRIADRQGTRSPWSAPAHWEMGLLTRQDWSGQWILAKEVKSDQSATSEPWARLVTLKSVPKGERSGSTNPSRSALVDPMRIRFPISN
jgi:hypothetical protein